MLGQMYRLLFSKEICNPTNCDKNYKTYISNYIMTNINILP